MQQISPNSWPVTTLYQANHCRKARHFTYQKNGTARMRHKIGTFMHIF